MISSRVKLNAGDVVVCIKDTPCGDYVRGSLTVVSSDCDYYHSEHFELVARGIKNPGRVTVALRAAHYKTPSEIDLTLEQKEIVLARCCARVALLPFRIGELEAEYDRRSDSGQDTFEISEEISKLRAELNQLGVSA